MKTTHFCCHRITRYARERNFVRFVIIVFFFLIFFIFFLQKGRVLLILTLIYPSFQLSIPYSTVNSRRLLSLIETKYKKINNCSWWIFAQGEKLRSSISNPAAVQLCELLVIRWFVNEIIHYGIIYNIHSWSDMLMDMYIHMYMVAVAAADGWLMFCKTLISASRSLSSSNVNLRFICNQSRNSRDDTHNSCFVRQSWAGIYKKLTRFFYWLAGSTCCHTKAYIAFRLLFYPWKSSYTSRDVVYVLCYVMSIPSSFCELLCVYMFMLSIGDVKGDRSQSIEWCQTTDENPHPSASRSNSLMDQPVKQNPLLCDKIQSNKKILYYFIANELQVIVFNWSLY